MGVLSAGVTRNVNGHRNPRVRGERGEGHMRRGSIATLALMVAGSFAAPLAVRAQEAPTTPAPPSEAEAYAARVELGETQVAAVGHTQAEATGDVDESNAHAGALEIGPEPPPSEQFGGTQEGAGEKKGGLIDTGGTDFDQLGRIGILPWSAAVSESGGARHAKAHAGLLEVLLAPGGTRILELNVLTSDSSADHTDAKSTSRAATDGVVVILGDPSTDQSLTLRILHSEASSESGSETFLLEIAGNKILTNSDDLGMGIAQICSAINIPGLLQLLCVQASGGAAEFAQAVLGDGAIGVADLFKVVQSGGAGAPAPEPEPPTVAGETEEAPAPAAPAAAGGMLPRTGAELAVFALALLVLALAVGAGAYYRRMEGAAIA